MGVDVSNRAIIEDARDQRFSLPAINKICVNHHVRGVKTTERQHAPPHRGRDLPADKRGGILPDKYWPLLAIRRAGGLVGMAQKQYAFPHICIIKANAAGRGVRLGDPHALRAMRSKRRIVERKKMFKRRGLKPNDLKVHNGLSSCKQHRPRQRRCWPFPDLPMRLNQITAPAHDLAASIALYEHSGLS